MRNTYRNLVPSHLRFLVAVHLILLAIFSTFRYITLLYNRPSYFFQADRSLSVWKAFKIGFVFDVTVASYALLLPYFLLTIAFIWPHPYTRLYKLVRICCGSAVLLSWIICAADVPYFNFFNSRLTVSAVSLKNTLQVVKYILSEVKYYPFILIGVVCIWSTGRLMRALWRRNWTQGSDYSMNNKWMATGLASTLLLCGLWGGATPQAPNMKKATFSNDGFINQLTLNPVHTWFDSYFDFDVAFLKQKEAIVRVREYFKIKDDTYDSPIARPHTYKGPTAANPSNVVVILLESMRASRMRVYGKNPHNLTPGLDSLARNSVFFNNCYSNGIHTNAGIYSPLYGMPIRMMEHPMNNGRSEFAAFTGLSVTLRDMGYLSKFFCKHPKTFYHLDVFFEKNVYEYESELTVFP